ncbi:MAG: hypothetical protein EZS28_009544, partial [Streblomastix strix]
METEQLTFEEKADFLHRQQNNSPNSDDNLCNIQPPPGLDSPINALSTEIERAMTTNNENQPNTPQYGRGDTQLKKKYQSARIVDIATNKTPFKSLSSSLESTKNELSLPRLSTKAAEFVPMKARSSQKNQILQTPMLSTNITHRKQDEFGETKGTFTFTSPETSDVNQKLCDNQQLVQNQGMKIEFSSLNTPCTENKQKQPPLLISPPNTSLLVAVSQPCTTQQPITPTR